MNLNQITILVSDVLRSVAFYQSLGLRVIVNALPGYVRLECPDGETTISLQATSELPAGPGVLLYFEVNDPAAVIEQLARKGINPELPLTDTPWLWQEACFRDPDNYRVIIFHAGENRKNPPWRVK